MIIFLYGPDSYRRKKNLKKLISKYREKYENADIERFDLGEDEGGVDDAKDFLRQPSMFAQSKIAVIEEATNVRNKDWVETLKDYLESDSVFILISDSSKKPVKKFRFLLNSPVRSQEFEELENKKLESFIAKQLQKNDIQLSKKAFKHLKSYAEAHDDKSWLIVNEVKKIALSDFDQPVSREDLEKLIAWVPRGKMYGHARRVFGSNSVAQRLIILEELLSRDESEAHVFNLLGYQAKGQAAEKLATLDVSIKSGNLEYEEALLDFVLN